MSDKDDLDAILLFRRSRTALLEAQGCSSADIAQRNGRLAAHLCKSAIRQEEVFRRVKLLYMSAFELITALAYALEIKIRS